MHESKGFCIRVTGGSLFPSTLSNINGVSVTFRAATGDTDLRDFEALLFFDPDEYPIIRVQLFGSLGT